MNDQELFAAYAAIKNQLPIPGEYDDMDAVDQAMWDRVIWLAFKAGIEQSAGLIDIADAVCKQFSAAGIDAVIGSPNPAEDLHARAIIALGGKVEREHITSAACWCEPVVDYEDPETGVKVLVHKAMQ